MIKVLQVIFAVTFLISGLAKCIDPAGTSIKFAEYLQYFGLDALCEITMPLAWTLSLIEFYCGISLLAGIRRVNALFLGSLFMLVFTPVTAWLAITDAIDDCGCFGDLVHLSNTATFLKNLLLDAILVILWIGRRYTYSLRDVAFLKLFKRCSLIAMGVLCWIGVSHEPFVDFRPFRSGVDLKSAVLANAMSETVTYSFIYRLGDNQQEFDIDHLPDESLGWEFVETLEHHDPTTSSAASSHIDFFVKTEDGFVFTDSLLAESGYSILLLSATLDQASQHDIDRIEMLSEYADDNQYPFYLITARDEQQLEAWRFNTGAEYDMLFTDKTIVQTICRTNPCVMLLHNGVICWKKPLSDLDTLQITSAKLNEQSSGEIQEIDHNRRFLLLLILLFAPFVIYLLVKTTIYIIHHSFKKKPKCVKKS